MDHGTGNASLTNRVDRVGESFDDAPKQHLDATLSLLDALVSSKGGAPIELFRRSSWRWRATRRAIEPEVAHQIGVEHGAAVRVATSERACAFAAASGAGIDAVRAAHELAIGGSVEMDEPGPFWAPGSGHPIWDVDPAAPTPDPAAIETWIREVDRPAGEMTLRAPADEIWVEYAVTIESLAAPQGLAVCRRRGRCWATRRVGDEIRTVAGRRLDRMDSQYLSRSGRQPTVLATAKAGRQRSIRFGPEPAAVLVAAMVPLIHGLHSELGRKVGPGWRIEDHPMAADGIGGGIFDDTGFPAARVILADGRQVRGLLSGPGHLFRGSYRNPPASRHTNLVIAGGHEGAPPADLLVDWVRLHPIGPTRWIGEFRGAETVDGDGVRGLIALGDPRELVQRCVSATGPAVATALGVNTPSLTFEGLSLL